MEKTLMEMESSDKEIHFKNQNLEQKPDKKTPPNPKGKGGVGHLVKF